MELFSENNFDISSKIEEEYQNNLILLFPRPLIPKKDKVFFWLLYNKSNIIMSLNNNIFLFFEQEIKKMEVFGYKIILSMNFCEWEMRYKLQLILKRLESIILSRTHRIPPELRS